MGDDPNEFGNSRRWIMREVENSLRRLGTDWIDLYQIHRPEAGHRHRRDARRADRPRPRRARSATSAPRRSPRARSWRRSGSPSAAAASASSASSRRTRCSCAGSRPTCCRPAGATAWASIPWSPLAGGWLSGKWRKGADDLTSRRSAMIPAALRPLDPGQPAQARCRRGARAARRRGRASPDPPGARVRDPPPGGHRGDHRPAHDGAPRVPARGGRRASSTADVLDRIDEIVPPGTNVNPADGGWQNPALETTARRR